MESKTKTNYLVEGIKITNADGEDEVIQIPYNLNNVLVKEDDIIQILNNYNVKLDKVNHIHFFQEAFTHKSYCKKDIFPDDILEATRKEMGNPSELLDLRPKSFERLEYFGDRVIKLIVSMYLFYRYPQQDEGFMTRLQTKIEDKTNLAIMSKEIGLDKFFIISKQIESMNGRNQEKIHEDCMESFLGALFLSNGFEPCLLLFVNLLETTIDYSEKLYRDNNYKDRLLRYYHAQQWKFPNYCVIHFEGPPHKRTYIMGVEQPDSKPDDHFKKKCIGFGLGKSKKEGEQAAAKMALINFGVLKDDQYTKSDLYFPPWDLLSEYDGENPILKEQEDQEKQEKQDKEDKEEDEKIIDDKSSVYSKMSDKSIDV
jgi:ribonuclease-3